MTENWIALAREAALAAEHMAIGATALSRADYAKHAYYGQAFFALSIGLERSAKLALVIDYAVRNGGTFPLNRDVRAFGHNLSELLQKVDEVAARINAQYRLPTSAIHARIIAILSEFATNITRYYNLDLLTNAPGIQGRTDPIQQWHDEVITAVLDAHYKPRQRKRDEQRAQILGEVLDPLAMVMHTSEDKRTLNSVSVISIQAARLKFAQPYVRLYVMQIMRFVGGVIGELGRIAQSQGLEDVPALSEFFAAYNNSDAYFKTRKSWSIYPG